jgi:hypothetical protein
MPAKHRPPSDNQQGTLQRCNTALAYDFAVTYNSTALLTAPMTWCCTHNYDRNTKGRSDGSKAAKQQAPCSTAFGSEAAIQAKHSTGPEYSWRCMHTAGFAYDLIDQYHTAAKFPKVLKHLTQVQNFESTCAAQPTFLQPFASYCCRCKAGHVTQGW